MLFRVYITLLTIHPSPWWDGLYPFPSRQTMSDLGSLRVLLTAPIGLRPLSLLSCRSDLYQHPPDFESSCYYFFTLLALHARLFPLVHTQVLRAMLYHAYSLGSESHEQPLRTNSISGALCPAKSATRAMRFLLWGTPQNCASCIRQAIDHLSPKMLPA